MAMNWKGVKQNAFPGKAGGSVDWKGVKCNSDPKKDKSDLTPSMGAVKSVERFKSTKMETTK